MNKSFAFAGDQAVGQIVARKLQKAGYALAMGLASADYIFTYALTQTQLEDIYLGTGGTIEQAKEGCCMIDLSPSTVTLAKEAYAIARVNELQAIDAPLVLKDPCVHDAFENSNVMLLVGGEDDAVADAMPLLHTLADEVRPVGLPGSGQLAKAMCTVQQAAALVSLVEARALSRAQGEDESVQAVEAAVAAGLVPRGALHVYQSMVDGHFHGSYSCRVLMSELTAVMNGAEDIGLVLPQAEACQHLLELFLVVGGGDLATPALSLAFAPDDETASFGLDWSRADGLFEVEHDHDHDHEHDHDRDFERGYRDEYDEYGYEYGYDDDEDGYGGGFGGFSAN